MQMRKGGNRRQEDYKGVDSSANTLHKIEMRHPGFCGTASRARAAGAQRGKGRDLTASTSDLIANLLRWPNGSKEKALS
jgi:hypothetical protein